MGFSLSKLLSSNSSKTIDSVDSIIHDVENTPFGVSENNVLYAGLNELGGYYFFQSVIIGSFNIRTKQGAQLFLIGNDFELQLNADMLELESETSNIKGRNITKIDFEIDASEAQKLDSSSVNTIRLKLKKHNIEFTRYTVINEEEE